MERDEIRATIRPQIDTFESRAIFGSWGGRASGKATWPKTPKWTPKSTSRSLSFERAIEELEIDRYPGSRAARCHWKESVAIYERGEALKAALAAEELLRQAEARVDKITTDAGGQGDRYGTARRPMIPGNGSVALRAKMVGKY